jgi:hypothetical protein
VILKARGRVDLEVAAARPLRVKVRSSSRLPRPIHVLLHRAGRAREFPLSEANRLVMRLLSRVVTAGRCRSCLGVSKVGGVERVRR